MTAPGQSKWVFTFYPKCNALHPLQFQQGLSKFNNQTSIQHLFFFCTDLNQTATKSLMRPAFCINFITRNTRLPQFWGCFLLALTAARGDEEIQRVSSCGWQSCCQQLAGDEGLQCLSHLQLLGPIKTLLRCIKYIPDIAFLCKQTQAGREVMWWGVGHETIF